MWLLTIAAVLAVCKVLAFLGMLEVAWLVALSWWWVIGAFVLTAAWFMAVALGGLTLVVGSFMPDPQVRDYLTSATGAALLLGVVLSWMQVLATRR